MTVSITFGDWQCNDIGPAIPQDDGLRRLLAFAGIHRVAAQTAIPPQGGVCNWDDSDPQCSLSIVADAATLVGLTADVWNRAFIAIDVSCGLVASFVKAENSGGFVFGGKAGLQRCYLVWWRNGRVGLSRLDGIDGRTETTLISVPATIGTTSYARVALKPISATAIDKIDDLAVTLWFDDAVMFSYTMGYDTQMGDRIGFAVYGTATAQYTEISVPQFHQLVEIASVGPTEQVAGGVGRILGMEQIRLQARFDGSALIWRNDAVTADVAVTSSEVPDLALKENLLSPTHFRLTGGLYEAGVYAGLDQVAGTEQHRGHIFVTANDPNVSVERDTFDRARRKARETLAEARTLELTVPFNPLLEAEDVIAVTFPYSSVPELFRITSVDFKSSASQDSAVFESRLTCRRLAIGF